MTTRLLIVTAMVACFVVGTWLVRRWLAYRTGRTLTTARWDAASTPAILAFSTPTCAECRLRQTPALETARAALGDAVRIVKVDALEEPEIASRFGVLTVPSSAVIDRTGKPVAMNHGFAPAGLLIAQAHQALAT